MRKQLRFVIFSVVLVNALGSLFASMPVQAAASGYRYGTSSNETVVERYRNCETSTSSKCDSISIYRYQAGTKYVFSGVEVTERPTITVNGSQPSRGTVKGGSDNGKTITITNTALFNKTFPDATAPPPAVEDPKTKVVNVTVSANYGTQNSADALPDDKITLKKPDNTVLQTATAPFEPPFSSSVQEFKASFSNVEPGSYKVCSEVILKGKCENVTKAKGAVAAVLISGNGSKADIKQDALAAGSPASTTCGGGFVLKWIVCPIITDINKMINWAFDEVIKPLLIITPLDRKGSGADLYKIWSSFRDLANVGFVLVFLFIIFGNATGVGVDAYTFKKALPRLVVAVVAVQASFLFMGIVIDIGNVLGAGVASLAQIAAGKPAGSQTAQTVVGATQIVAVGAATALVAGAVAAWPLILLAFLGLLISLVGFIVTIIMRVLIINVLIILSPIAIVAWVLPNTERYAKMWFSNLIKAVLMYPLIVLLVSMANIISASSSAIANQGGNSKNLGAAMIALFAPIIAFSMMPMVFKMSGVLMGAAASAVRNRTAGVSKRVVEPAKQAARQGMQEKNAVRLGEGGRISRGLTRIGSGNAFSFGAVGKRKIAASKELAESKLIGDYEKGYIDKNMDNVDLKKQLKSGVGLSGKNLDQFEKRAILRRLGAQNGDKELISLFKDGTVDREDLRRGLDPGSQSRLAKKAPHIIRADKEAAYVKLSGEAAAGLDSSVSQEYVNNARLTDEGRFNFVNSAASISQSAGLRANANTNLRNAYLDAKKNSHEYQSQTVNINGIDMTGHQFLQAFVNTNGTVAATESLTAADIQARVATVAPPTLPASPPLAEHPMQP